MAFRIYHVAWPLMKHIENSLRGIRRAAALNYDAIDLDLLITKDGVIVVTHWDRPLKRDGFRDPEHRIAFNAKVRDLTWRQVKRLRTPDGYKIVRVGRALRACANQNIIAYLEPKDDVRFELDWPWQRILRAAARHGALVRVRSLRDFATPNAGLRRVQAARRNGVARAHTI